MTPAASSVPEYDPYLDAVAEEPDPLDDLPGHPFRQLLELCQQGTPGPSSTRAIYLQMGIHASGNSARHAWPLIDTLSFFLQLSRRLVQMRIAPLVDAGLLVPVPHPPGQKRRSRRYQVRVGIDIANCGASTPARPFPRVVHPSSEPDPHDDSDLASVDDEGHDDRQLCLIDLLDAVGCDAADDPAARVGENYLALTVEERENLTLQPTSFLVYLHGYSPEDALDIVREQAAEKYRIRMGYIEDPAEAFKLPSPPPQPGLDLREFAPGTAPRLIDGVVVFPDSSGADACDAGSAERSEPADATAEPSVSSPPGSVSAADADSPADGSVEPASHSSEPVSETSDPVAAPVSESVVAASADSASVAPGERSAEPVAGSLSASPEASAGARGGRVPRPPSSLAGFASLGSLAGVVPRSVAAGIRRARFRPPSADTAAAGAARPPGVQPVAHLASGGARSAPPPPPARRSDPGRMGLDVSRLHVGGASPFNDAAHRLLHQAGWRYDGACWHGPDCRHGRG